MTILTLAELELKTPFFFVGKNGQISDKVWFAEKQGYGDKWVGWVVDGSQKVVVAEPHPDGYGKYRVKED